MKLRKYTQLFFLFFKGENPFMNYGEIFLFLEMIIEFFLCLKLILISKVRGEEFNCKIGRLILIFFFFNCYIYVFSKYFIYTFKNDL